MFSFGVAGSWEPRRPNENPKDLWESIDDLPRNCSGDEFGAYWFEGWYRDGAELAIGCAPTAGYDPYKSDMDGERLTVGVPVTLAKGPTSASGPFPDAEEAASLSSPATKLLNLDHIDPDTFSRLGLDIQDEPPSLVVCLKRVDKSSTAANKCICWYPEGLVVAFRAAASVSQYC